MKKTYSLLLLVFIMMLSSCQETILKMSGFRKPMVEDKQSVFKYLRSLKQDTDEVYTLDTNLFQKFRYESFKPNWAHGFRPAQIRMYDKSGAPVLQWTICEGFLKDLKTFDSLPPRNVNGLNNNLKLQDDLSQYYSLSGQPANIIAPDGYDYYILIYFAKYFPRLSKESFRKVDDYVEKYKNVKFMIYKINVDIQKFWGTEINTETQVTFGKH
jgi:hypothetical protein